jgi:hypothetical protein
VLPASFWSVSRTSGPVFMFCAPGPVFGCTEGVGFCFHVLCSHTPFRRYLGRRVPFRSFALSNSFLIVPWASSPVFMFCASGLIFGSTKGVESRFHVLRSGTLLGQYRGCRSRFHVLRSRTHFRRYRGRRVLFSCFVLPDSFGAVPRASGPVFMFCAPRLFYGDTEAVGSNFHALRSQTHSQQYQGCGVQFSCFALPDSY